MNETTTPTYRVKQQPVLYKDKWYLKNQAIPCTAEEATALGDFVFIPAPPKARVAVAAPVDPAAAIAATKAEIVDKLKTLEGELTQPEAAPAAATPAK